MLRDDPKLIEKAVHTIQMLAVDAVEKANSGHPGTPMALASITVELFLRHLRYDPTAPDWQDRDRFVLSAGHASMLLYSVLHLAGYDLSMDELKRFRQLKSKTPGHPESFMTKGVEVTTGPLGQGISNAVGMAAAIKMMGARFNQYAPLSTGRVFGIASDGDLMEGVSGEASSLAGHLGLDNLIFFYDDNHITIDGETSLAFSEDVGKRYEAYGWFVQHIYGHDHAQIRAALDKAVANEGKPSLIVARTHIGIGSPKQDSHKAHGEPLGPDAIKATRAKIGWPDETFFVPDEVRALFAERAVEGKKMHAEWQQVLQGFLTRGDGAPALWEQITKKAVPDNLFEELLKVVPQKDAATRVQSGVIEQRAAALVPSLVGGSADLNPSTKTYIEGSPALAAGKYEGRNVHFGIREHAMGAFVNGMALTDGFIPFGATFLVFSDYMRPSVRLAALSRLQALFIYTHDSVYLGEDGPTHQPVEHFWALRLIPNLDFFRPCDALECAAAWTHGLTRRDGPTAFALSRQKLVNIPRPDGFDPKVMLRGAYTIAPETGGEPTLVIIATGSEVEVAVNAKKILDGEGERVRVVSAPCLEQFGRQDASYRDSLLPPGVPRVSIELGVTAPWYSIVGANGLVIGLDRFGESAPDKDLAKYFGFVPDVIASKIRAWRGTAAKA